MTAMTLEAFEEQAREFLDANLEKKAAERTFVWGEGSDKVAMFEERSRTAERADLQRACEWRAKKYDAGFGWITGPTEYGGRGLTGAYERAWGALEAQYEAPNQSAFTIGLGMIAPTILAHGSDAAKDAYLRKLYRADIVACQLFSEPGAGSDLASLQTKAVRDGDEWVITGQKVWTTGAQYSDIGEIIARTDPDLPKHKGLTGFIVDMKAPGVEVRPLRQMTGGASFNEVFFEEVRVRDDRRLGDVNNGWNVALTTLMNERAAIGAGVGGSGGGLNLTARLIEMVRHFEVADDPVVRGRLADVIIQSRVSSYTNQRAVAKIRAGQLPGPEMSIAKLAGSQNVRRIADFVSEVLGPRLIADTGEWGTYAWSMLVLGGPGGRIAGGSDEVMRNIIGERVLGLPKEPGIDSKSPFRDLKVGTQASPA
ncbi:MAG TPA: acyl-CoA dehydrogenase family protein [Ilumatobacteraceae bacterium]|nr:acyl-CoA dehydrogenase family protein [Ilumatobacteraceae bacterium]